MHNRMMLPNSPTSPTITVAQLASSGMPYAFNIWTVYGRIARMPVNCDNRKMDMTNKNGFSVRLRVSSRILSMIVGAGCGHLTFCLMHTLHELDRSLYRWSDLNSCSTPLGDTQPRSHCNDFNASSVRFFDSSHNGVSGTWNETCIEIAKTLWKVNPNNINTHEANGNHGCDWNGETRQGSRAPRHQTSHQKNDEKTQGGRDRCTWNQDTTNRWLTEMHSENMSSIFSRILPKTDLPDLTDIGNDRRFHQSNPKSKHNIGCEHFANGRGIVHHYPGDKMRNIHQKHCSLSAQRLGNPSGENAPGWLANVRNAGEPRRFRWCHSQILVGIVAICVASQCWYHDCRKRHR